MEGGRKHYHDGGRSSNLSVVRKLLAKKTSFFDLKFYILAGICVGCLITIVLLTILWFFCNRSSRKRRLHVNHTSCLVRMIQEEITEMKASNRAEKEEITDSEKTDKDEKGFSGADASKVSVIENRSAESNLSGESKSSASVISAEVPYIGWGRWYSLKELEIATVGFSEESVIGEGGYGIVYRGVLADGSVVAVKNLFNNKGQAEKEFQVEVEAIGKVRHKNLVGLIGYCVEGVQRWRCTHIAIDDFYSDHEEPHLRLCMHPTSELMLVYEYVDNGNLEHWLHGNVGPVSPLTWDVRMKIAVGTAKGLAYLHEGLEPKVVHRDIKSSNILLDKKWNPKVSDFGLAKLLGSDTSHVTTRVMGTFGYVAPEYASSGKLNEGSDVYSFGILLMEIISGRNPVDYTRPAGEVNLVEWFKVKIASRCGEELVDPLIEVQPSPRALKRVLLVCLRCIHVDAGERPNMGQVVHMLEAEEAPFRGERWLARDRGSLPLRAGPVFYGETPFLSRRSSQEGK